MDIVEILQKDKLDIEVYRNRSEMGMAAAAAAANRINELARTREEINIVFAAAPSQNEFLEGLVKEKSIQWGKINAFHLDEYIGLNSEAPQCFGNFLKRAIFEKVEFKNTYYINGNAGNFEEECNRYSALLQNHPIDIAFLGIGENGHLAFNDPPVADFNDKYFMKVVTLDEVCRNQQVNDGCFESLSHVPKNAFTLTIPAILSATYIYCMVPGKTKAEAVKATLFEPISEVCPASVLRKHDCAKLYIDVDSAAMIL